VRRSVSVVLAGDGERDVAVQWQIRCFGAFSDVDGGGSGIGFGEATAKLSSLHGGSGEAAGARPARSSPPSSSTVTVPVSARAPTVGSSSAVPLPARKRCDFCFLGVTGVLWFACGFGGFSGSSASSTVPLCSPVSFPFPVGISVAGYGLSSFLFAVAAGCFFVCLQVDLGDYGAAEEGGGGVKVELLMAGFFHRGLFAASQCVESALCFRLGKNGGLVSRSVARWPAEARRC